MQQRAADVMHKCQRNKGKDDIGKDYQTGCVRHGHLESLGAPAPLVDNGGVPNGLGRDTACGVQDGHQNGCQDLYPNDDVQENVPGSCLLQAYQQQGDTRLRQGYRPRRRDLSHYCHWRGPGESVEGQKLWLGHDDGLDDADRQRHVDDSHNLSGIFSHNDCE